MILSVYTDYSRYGKRYGDKDFHCGIAVVMKTNDNFFYARGKHYCPNKKSDSRSDTGECLAILEALRAIKLVNLSLFEAIVIHSDSLAVVNQLNDRELLTMRKFQPRELQTQIKNMAKSFEIPVYFKWIPRLENKLADYLAGKAKENKAHVVYLGNKKICVL